MTPSDSDDDYYDIHYQSYFAATVNVDPSSFLQPLASYLPFGAEVLDIGCGSGRDLLWLKRHGFQPTGLERSAGLADLARKHSGCEVIVADFLKYNFSGRLFNAMVSVGAFVHLAHDRLPGLLRSLLDGLRTPGYVLLTVKEGSGTMTRSDGRLFTLWEQEALEAVFRSRDLAVVDFARQMSKLRSDDIWLSYLLKHSSPLADAH